MKRNAELINKADMALADLANGGALNPEMSDRFLRQLMDTPTILSVCRTVGMNSPTMKINKIGFGSRILKPAVEATGLVQGDRTAPTLSKVELTTKEVMAEIRLPYSVIEDNVERTAAATNNAANSPIGGLQSTIVDMIAQRAALDLEEMGIKGDTALNDGTILDLTDGWLKRATTNIVNAGAVYSKDVVKAVAKLMPSRFMRNPADLVHFVSTQNAIEIRDVLASRQTQLGDSNVVGINPTFVFGSQVRGAAMMPAANSLFTNPLNLIFGIQRNISIEFDKDIRTREYIIVLTTRVDFQVEEEPAMVKVTNLL